MSSTCESYWSHFSNALAGLCPTVDKPWGREIWWASGGKYAGKLICVKAGHSLSLQYHEKKHETMLFVCGDGYIDLDDKRIRIAPPTVVDIAPGIVHRVTAIEDVMFIEASTAELDDVVRIQDAYGRLGPSKEEAR